MKILALEFSSAQRSVAIVDVGTKGASLHHEVMETGGRETKAFAMIDEVLRQAGSEREDIDCIAVGLGPGSYNGIRVAIAVAQGWQMATEVKLLGISSVECLAAEAQAAGLRGPAHFIVDAQRNELYWASFNLTDQNCEPIQQLRLATPDEVRGNLQSSDLVLGPEVTKWFAQGRNLSPQAAHLGNLAATRIDFVSAEKLEPIYLRETAFIKAPKPRNIF
jgi:tRNA threonylcarbamoyl adenosine modification protein YeaZ